LTWEPKEQGSLLVPSGPNNGMHLFVVVTKMCANGMHLLLSISSIKDGKKYDNSCVLEAEEHEFIDRRSFVYYKMPEQRRASGLVKCVESGLFKPRENVSADVFDRICKGLERSDFTPPWALTYFYANK
jgi:hypothetical protein